jgi:hypothetical protein
MRVSVHFNGEQTDADIIDVPSCVISDLDTVLKRFWSWLFDKSNNHDYWVLQNGEKSYCNYRSDAFVFWLNDCYLVNEPEVAKIIEMCAKEVDPNLPKVFM